MRFIFAKKKEIKQAVAVTPANIDETITTPEDGNCMGQNGLGGDHAQRLWVGGAGNVNLVFADGNTLILHGVIVGRWHKIPPTRNIQSTSTTATNIRVASVWE